MMDVVDHGPGTAARVRDAARLKDARIFDVRTYVAVEDAPDIAAPDRTVRRARLIDGYAVLHRRGLLDDPQHEACWRWHATFERGVCGARGAGIDLAAVRAVIDPATYTPVSEAQLRSLSDHMIGRRALHRRQADLLDLFVLHNASVRSIATHWQMPVQRVMGALLASIDTLVHAWSLDT